MTRTSIRSRSDLARVIALCCLFLPAVGRGETTEDFAKAEFRKGHVAYELGRFEEALTAYAVAYEVKPLPGLLFDMGQCHRHLGNYAQAAFFYRQFLDKIPADSPDAAVARGLLQEMSLQSPASAPTGGASPSGLAAVGASPGSPGSRPLNLSPADARLAPDPLGLQAGTGSEPTATDEPITSRWWFWIGIAATVVIGGTVAAYVATLPRASPGSLGTIQGG